MSYSLKCGFMMINYILSSYIDTFLLYSLNFIYFEVHYFVYYIYCQLTILEKEYSISANAQKSLINFSLRTRGSMQNSLMDTKEGCLRSKTLFWQNTVKYVLC